MSRVYRWRQTVTYAVTMRDANEVDPETGKGMTEAEIDESAREWMLSAMPIEYYPEDFVTVDTGPVEYLGLALLAPGGEAMKPTEPVACCADGKCLGHPTHPPPSVLCSCGYPLSEHAPHSGGLLAGRLYCAGFAPEVK